jgi:hypothetical protein
MRHITPPSVALHRRTIGKGVTGEGKKHSQCSSNDVRNFAHRPSPSFENPKTSRSWQWPSNQPSSALSDHLARKHLRGVGDGTHPVEDLVLRGWKCLPRYDGLNFNMVC